jgi:hypothetical protein
MSTGNRKPPGRPKEEAERAAIAARQDDVRAAIVASSSPVGDLPLDRLAAERKLAGIREALARRKESARQVAAAEPVIRMPYTVAVDVTVDEDALATRAWKGTMRALLEHMKRSHEIGPRHRGMPVNYDRRLRALGGLEVSPAENRRDEQIDQIMRAAACDEHTARGDWYWLKNIYEGLQVTAVYDLLKNDGNG